jgi:putative ABC transport system permease protein
VSMILLSAAGLLIRSFQKVEGQHLGMDTGGVLTVRIALPRSNYDSGEKKMQFYLSAEAAVRRMPGVRAVGWSDSIPPDGWSNDRRFSDFAVSGRPRPTTGTGGSVIYRQITPDYFRAFDIPLIRGRNFSEEDRKTASSFERAPDIPVIQGQHLAAELGDASEHELIVSKLMAARLFAGENAIGQRVQMGSRGAWSTIVGVADNVKNGGLTEQDAPEVYSLRRDVPEDWEGQVALSGSTGGSGPVMVVKTVLSTSSTAAWIHSQVAHLDPAVPMEIEPLTQYVNKLADRPRFETVLLSFFAFTGLAMAVIGLYGVISFLARQHTQEIGVRMALGAGRSDILRLIAWEGMRLILAGGIVGLLFALGISRIFKSFLFNVGPYDPISFAVVGALLVFVTTIATILPASSAMKTDPLVALHYE